MKRKGFFPPIMTSSSTISNSESISLQLDEHRSVIDSSSGSSVLLKLSLDSFAPLFGDESLDSSSKSCNKSSLMSAVKSVLLPVTNIHHEIPHTYTYTSSY